MVRASYAGVLGIHKRCCHSHGAPRRARRERRNAQMNVAERARRATAWCEKLLRSRAGTRVALAWRNSTSRRTLSRRGNGSVPPIQETTPKCSTISVVKGSCKLYAVASQRYKVITSRAGGILREMPREGVKRRRKARASRRRNRERTAKRRYAGRCFARCAKRCACAGGGGSVAAKASRGMLAVRAIQNSALTRV